MKLKVYNNEKGSPAPNQPIQPGTCAVILNKNGKVFLHKRNDSDLWSLPGGTMELGESIRECCLREVREETGLRPKILRLVGIYTSPKCVFEWSDSGGGRVWQVFVVSFLCETSENKVKLNDESSDFKWFLREEIEKLETLPYVKETIRDALVERGVYFD